MPYEDTGLGGNSGTSGVSAVHDAGLVSTIRTVGRKRKKYSVVCPQAGKLFCFAKFQRSLMQLPLDQAHVVIYDNSRSERHRARLVSLTKSLPSFTLVEDRNPPASIESTDSFRNIIRRCSDVYQQIYEQHLPAKSDFVINLEDDIESPKGGFDRLLNVMQTYDGVGTVIGNCHDRRVFVSNGRASSIAVNFTKSQPIGGTGETLYEVTGMPERQFGVEAIGAGHMGLWLARRECVEQVGMRTIPEPSLLPLGHDIQYGLRLNEAGWKFAIDWSVPLKHYYQRDGSTLSC
tara:strand:- start:11453 stop:12322 length:870 start_codon:yes stop_codon:yes gene_type:complete